MSSSHDLSGYYAHEDDRAGLRVVRDTDSINASYDRYLRSTVFTLSFVFKFVGMNLFVCQAICAVCECLDIVVLCTSKCHHMAVTREDLRAVDLVDIIILMIHVSWQWEDQTQQWLQKSGLLGQKDGSLKFRFLLMLAARCLWRACLRIALAGKYLVSFLLCIVYFTTCFVSLI